MAAFACLTSVAQEVAYLPLFEDYTTKVVRQYSDKESVYYMEKGDAHFFVLYNRGTPTTAVVSKFPSYYDLHDFEVLRDTVYFCGVKPGSSPKGMVGFIPVLDLFYTGGSYTFGLIDDLMMFSMATSCHMSSIDRMDVFVDSDSLTHFAVVGRLEQTATFGQDSRRTVADVWYDHHPNTPHWRGRVLYQKEDLYQPKDTVVLPELAPMPYDSVTMKIMKEPELPDYTFPISAGVTVPCENGDAKMIIDDKKR